MQDQQDYTITLEEAQKRTDAWKSDQAVLIDALGGSTGAANLSPVNIHGFTFKLDDLFNLCIRIYNYNNPSTPIDVEPGIEIENPVNAIRFYLGKKADEMPGGAYGCLIGVGVKEFDPENQDGGKDVYDLPDFKTPVTSSIYDFSYPCPTTCAQKNFSLINHPKTNKSLKDL